MPGDVRQPEPPPRGAGGDAEIEAGHRASPAELRRRLARASARFADGAVDNPHLGRVELLLLLRNRAVTAATLRRIAGRPEWRRYHAVRAALVLHPHTPATIARNLVGHLFWKELCEVAVAPHAHPPVRRQAERLLRAQLGELGIGQRVSLARRASRGLIAGLQEASEATVLDALLDNPRLVEADVVRLASRRSAPVETLGRLGHHPRWGPRRNVQLALARNARTPAAAALRLLARLDRRDLQGLARDVSAARLIRIGAERMLQRKGAAAVDGAHQNS